MCGFHSEGRKKQHLVTTIKNDTSMDEKKTASVICAGFLLILDLLENYRLIDIC